MIAFILTLTYVCLAYLSPVALFPAIAEYRLQLWIAIAAMISAIPRLLTSAFLRSQQMPLFLGLAVAICLSNLLATGWVGGVIPAFSSFFANAVPMVLLGVTCTTMRRLRAVALLLVGVAIYYVVLGANALLEIDTTSAYILMQGELPRIRGFASLNDPNDLAQFVVFVLPMLWMWRRGSVLTALVLIFTVLLSCGVYLTHSRGGAVALLAVLLFAAKDRIGKFLTVVSLGVVLALMRAVEITGGRGVSDDSTMGRLYAWSAGLDMLKSHPVLGVGFGQFMEHHERTAHNSFVLALAELGVVGYFFWIGLIVVVASQVTEMYRGGSGAEGGSGGHSFSELQRWAGAIRTSLVGFLAASWFLSRSYTITLYVLLGIGTAIVLMQQAAEASDQNTTQPTSYLRRIAVYEVVSVVLLYAMVRMRPLL